MAALRPDDRSPASFTSLSSGMEAIFCSMISTVPSVEPPSAMTISSGLRVPLTRASIRAAMLSASLNTVMTTETFTSPCIGGDGRAGPGRTSGAAKDGPEHQAARLPAAEALPEGVGRLPRLHRPGGEVVGVGDQALQLGDPGPIRPDLEGGQFHGD